jgi:hypothetical protein
MESRVGQWARSDKYIYRAGTLFQLIQEKEPLHAADPAKRPYTGKRAFESTNLQY